MRAALGLAFLLLLAGAPARAERVVVDWQYGYVNVRSGPSTEAAAVGRLAEGGEAEALEERDDWTRIRYPGGEGWVVSRSLRPLPAVTASPEPAASASVAAPPPVVDAPAARPAPPPPPETDPDAAAAPAGEAPPPTSTQTPPPGPRVEEGNGAPPSRPGYLSDYLDRPAPSAPEAGTGLVRMVSGLLLVLALLGGAAYAVRRLGGRRLGGGDRRGGAIRVLATRSLGPRTGLVLVEVEGLVWLLAQGPEGASRIAEIRDADALRRLNDRYGFLETPFEAELRRTLEPEEAPVTGAGEEETPGSEAEDSAPTPEERLAALRRRPGAGDTP